MNINYINEISVEDYNYLRKSVGWNLIEEKQAMTGLKNSLFTIVAMDDMKTVGISRVVGDGGYIIIIVDVIVLPAYQGNGIGKTMLTKVMEYINNSLEPGQGVFVNLMSAKGRESFYGQFGFETRPNDRVGCGMTQWISK